jgi:hypothetical protein
MSGNAYRRGLFRAGIAANIAKLPELLGTYDASAGCGPTEQKNGTNERCALTPIPFEIAHTHTSDVYCLYERSINRNRRY